jgi:CPA1 family monovalent cation:H+ antiporter
LTIRKKLYQESEHPIGKIKSGVIFSLAGARGTVTLASVMSIPLMLTDGSLFPERNLIILLASGVIVVSLLITNFLLPLFVERKTGQGKNEKELTAYAEIIQKVSTRLLSEAAEENRKATEIVVRSYYDRNAASKGEDMRLETDEDKKLESQILVWQRDNTLSMLEKKEIDETTAKHFIEILDTRIKAIGRGRKFFHRMTWFVMHMIRHDHFKGKNNGRTDFGELLTANNLFVLEKLKKIRNDENARAVDKVIPAYEMIAALYMRRAEEKEKPEDGEVAISLIYEVAARGFHIERGLIQEMFEAGRISRETAKEMRGNIATLETRLQAD